MKKRLVAVLFTLMALCLSAFCFTACGETVSVENVTLNKSTLTLEVGEEETLTATITPESATDKSVTWESSDEDVATVSNGKVTAVANGRTTVTVTTVDGEKTAMCEVIVIASSGLTFKTLSVDEENNVTGIVSNSIDEFSFLTEIETSGNVGYMVCADEFGMIPFAAKKAPLLGGDTTVYILVLENGEYNGITYAVTIHRNYLYTVSFKTGVATSIPSQQVEEGDCAIMPTTELTKIGYHFDGWGFDFDTPITSNKTLNAIWTANTDTTYRVEYYLENANDDGYMLFGAENNSGVTDTTASVTPSEKEHYTINESRSKTSGKIKADGSLVLQVYYDLDRYTITVDSSDVSLGTVTGGGTYKYGTHLNMVATTNKIGYLFVGWFNGETKVSNQLTYSFLAEENLDLIAKWELDPAISNFNFTSTESVCEITGLKDENVTQIVIPDYVTSIGDRAFEDCDSLQTVTIGTGIESIPIAAFYSCDNLASVNNGINIKSIGRDAFEYCANLTALDFGYNLEEIDHYAFNGCTKLTIVKFGDKIKSLGVFAFGECEQLCRVYYSGTIDQWASLDFNGSLANPLFFANALYINNQLVKEINITTATKISPYVFDNYNVLERVTIGTSVESIGDNAFNNCFNIEKLTLSNNVKSIGSGAFRGCVNIQELVIPDSVESIGAEAFKDCTQIMDVTIGDGVKSIGEKAFHNWESLTKTSYRGTTNEWAVISFGDIYSNPIYYSKTVYINNQPLTELKLDGMKEISDYAFADCETLLSVEIGNSVETIGRCAFSRCEKLLNAVIGDNVKTIGMYAFSDCWELNTVKMGHNVEQIDTNAFSYTEITTISLDAKITVLTKYLFASCDKLESIVLGTSVKKTEYWTFGQCTALKYIFVKGSPNELNITIHSSDYYFTNATRYYYIENQADVPTDGGNYWHYVNGVPTPWNS